MSTTSLVNPYLQARQLLQMSQQEVSDGAGVSVSCVRYNEQGLFLNPIPKLTDFYARLFLREALVRNYYRFQRRTRQENKRMWLLPEPNLFQEPLRATFKFNGIGVTRFTKQYCCQSVLLWQPKRILKTDLGNILKQAGFTPVQLQELHDRLQDYYEARERASLRSNRAPLDNLSGAEVFRDGRDTVGAADLRLTGTSRYDGLKLS